MKSCAKSYESKTAVHCRKNQLLVVYFAFVPVFTVRRYASAVYTVAVANLGEIPTGSPPMGARNRCGVGSNWRFSTNISLYFKNGAR